MKRKVHTESEMVKAVQELEGGIDAETVARNHGISKATLYNWKSKYRGKDVLLDRDVALLYGVETRIVNQAVRNNPKKFPKDYIIELDEEESSALRSKILTLEQKGGKGTSAEDR